MQIGPVRMGMVDRRVLVHVTMLTSYCRGVMCMVMMLVIMTMSMIMQQWFVGMFMIVFIAKCDDQCAN